MGYRGVLNRCRECMQLLCDDMIDMLQTFVGPGAGPAEVAADARYARSAPMASGFGFADLVTIIAGQASAFGPSGLHVETSRRRPFCSLTPELTHWGTY